MKAKTELRVTGLGAPGLVRTVEEDLAAVEGVEYAHVNLGAGKVTVEFDDSVVGVDELLGAVRNAGLEAEQE